MVWSYRTRLFLLVSVGVAIFLLTLVFTPHYVLGIQSSIFSGVRMPAQEESWSRPVPREPEPLPTITPPSTPEPIEPSASRLLEEAANMEGVPPERLAVVYLERFDLPITGAKFTYAKVMDKATGRTFPIGLDQEGNVVDPEALRQAERAALVSQYGKLHPSLAHHLGGLGEHESVRVSIWLDIGDREVSIERISPERASSMGLEAMQEHLAEERARLEQVHKEIQEPLLRFLPTVGARVLGAAENAPLVFAELPVQAIQQVAELPYVQAIDLLVEGGPEDTDKTKEKALSGPELESAQPTSKASIVHARGITGSDVMVAVVEGDSIAFENPYLEDGICGPTSTCPTINEHATAVGGIIASTHSTVRGVAPGVGASLLSANGDGWGLEHHQLATSWALGQGASVFNNSYYLETDGVMHNSDRWLDYIARHFAVLEVKSAGNRGEGDGHVTSPGLGYNVLTVGCIEDKDTLTWNDDEMAEFSSYNEPPGREKPEVSAVGCEDSDTELGIQSTGMYSPWIYDQGCGTSYAAPIVAGGGALLVDRDPALESWPEAVKAILIATALHNIEGDSRISEFDGAGAVDLAAADTVAANGWWRGTFSEDLTSRITISPP